MEIIRAAITAGKIGSYLKVGLLGGENAGEYMNISMDMARAKPTSQAEKETLQSYFNCNSFSIRRRNKKQHDLYKVKAQL